MKNNFGSRENYFMININFKIKVKSFIERYASIGIWFHESFLSEVIFLRIMCVENVSNSQVAFCQTDLFKISYQIAVSFPFNWRRILEAEKIILWSINILKMKVSLLSKYILVWRYDFMNLFEWSNFLKNHKCRECFK